MRLVAAGREGEEAMKRSTLHTNEGQYIELYWERDALEHYVRGHVCAETGAEALKTQGLDASEFVGPTHEYGRWSQDAACKPDGCTAVLKVYKEPGRGRFKITVYRATEEKP
jgi:hypothetical protein